MKTVATLTITLSLLLSTAFSSALAAERAAPGPEQFAPQDMIAFAMLMLQSQHFDTAEKVARDGIAAHPTSPGFHLVLAEALRGQQKRIDAFYEYQLEIVQEGPAAPTADAAARRSSEMLDGSSVEAHEMVRVLQTLKESATEPDAAAKEFALIEAKRGKRIVLELYRAEALQSSGALPDAAEVFEALLAHSPAFVPAMVELAEVRRAQGDAVASRDLLAKAKALDPKNWRLRAAAAN